MTSVRPSNHLGMTNLIFAFNLFNVQKCYSEMAFVAEATKINFRYWETQLGLRGLIQEEF